MSFASTAKRSPMASASLATERSSSGSGSGSGGGGRSSLPFFPPPIGLLRRQLNGNFDASPTRLSSLRTRSGSPPRSLPSLAYHQDIAALSAVGYSRLVNIAPLSGKEEGEEKEAEEGRSNKSVAIGGVSAGFATATTLRPDVRPRRTPLHGPVFKLGDAPDSARAQGVVCARRRQGQETPTTAETAPTTTTTMTVAGVGGMQRKTRAPAPKAAMAAAANDCEGAAAAAAVGSTVRNAQRSARDECKDHHDVHDHDYDHRRDRDRDNGDDGNEERHRVDEPSSVITPDKSCTGARPSPPCPPLLGPIPTRASRAASWLLPPPVGSSAASSSFGAFAIGGRGNEHSSEGGGRSTDAGGGTTSFSSVSSSTAASSMLLPPRSACSRKRRAYEADGPLSSVSPSALGGGCSTPPRQVFSNAPPAATAPASASSGKPAADSGASASATAASIHSPLLATPIARRTPTFNSCGAGGSVKRTAEAGRTSSSSSASFSSSSEASFSSASSSSSFSDGGATSGLRALSLLSPAVASSVQTRAPPLPLPSSSLLSSPQLLSLPSSAPLPDGGERVLGGRGGNGAFAVRPSPRAANGNAPASSSSLYGTPPPLLLPPSSKSNLARVLEASSSSTAAAVDTTPVGADSRGPAKDRGSSQSAKRPATAFPPPSPLLSLSGGTQSCFSAYSRTPSPRSLSGRANPLGLAAAGSPMLMDNAPVGGGGAAAEFAPLPSPSERHDHHHQQQQQQRRRWQPHPRPFPQTPSRCTAPASVSASSSSPASSFSSHRLVPLTVLSGGTPRTGCGSSGSCAGGCGGGGCGCVGGAASSFGTPASGKSPLLVSIDREAARAGGGNLGAFGVGEDEEDEDDDEDMPWDYFAARGRPSARVPSLAGEKEGLKNGGGGVGVSGSVRGGPGRVHKFTLTPRSSAMTSSSSSSSSGASSTVIPKLTPKLTPRLTPRHPVAVSLSPRAESVRPPPSWAASVPLPSSLFDDEDVKEAAGLGGARAERRRQMLPTSVFSSASLGPSLLVPTAGISNEEMGAVMDGLLQGFADHNECERARHSDRAAFDADDRGCAALSGDGAGGRFLSRRGAARPDSDEQEDSILLGFKARSVLEPSSGQWGSMDSIEAMLERDRAKRKAARAAARCRLGEDECDEEEDEEGGFILDAPQAIVLERIARAEDDRADAEASAVAAAASSSSELSHSSSDRSGPHARRRRRRGSSEDPRIASVHASVSGAGECARVGSTSGPPSAFLLPKASSSPSPASAIDERECAKTHVPLDALCLSADGKAAGSHPSTVTFRTSVNDQEQPGLPKAGSGTLRTTSFLSRTSSTSLFGMEIVHENSVSDFASARQRNESCGSGRFGSDLSAIHAESATSAAGADGAYGSNDNLTLSRSDHSFGSLGLALDGPGYGCDNDVGSVASRDLVTPPAQTFSLCGGSQAGGRGAQLLTPPPLLRPGIPNGKQHGAVSVCVAPADQRSVKLAIAKMASATHFFKPKESAL